MIKVGMRCDDTGRFDFDIFDEPNDSFRLVAGVNDDGFAARFENVAVSLQLPNHQRMNLGHSAHPDEELIEL
jgi:hypothetical protein